MDVSAKLGAIYYLIRRQGMACFALIILSVVANADERNNSKSILFIISKASPAYTQVVKTVKEKVQSNGLEYTFSMLVQDDSSAIDRALKQADLIMTVGAGAAEAAIKRQPSQPLVAALITDSAFSSLATRYFGSKAAALTAGVSVVCLDQPVLRSISLARLLMPEAVKVGLMVGPASEARSDEFSEQIKGSGMQPNLVSIKASDNPITTIEPVLKASDIFIAVPDSRLINIATARWILQLSYRHKVPVIAYSKTYLNAGALAAIYSSPENVGMQAAELILSDDILSSETGGIHLPNYFSVQFNTSVAAHLGIRLKKKQFYLDQLRGG